MPSKSSTARKSSKKSTSSRKASTPKKPVAAQPTPAAHAPDERAPGTEAAAPTGAATALAPQFGGDPHRTAPARAGRGKGGYVSARPLLVVGSAGPHVTELALLLDEAGYPNPIANGERAAPHALDDAMMRLVQEFQRANDVDPSSPEGDDATNGPLVNRRHSGIVDARTWEALLGEAPELKRGVPA